jgi:bifunctional non-homologous end joining protein LigD
VTNTYPELWALREALGSTRAVLDGEVVAFGEGGRPDFGLLAHRIHVSDPGAAHRLAATAPVRYLIFDLLYLDGHPTTELSYDDRRALLEALPGLTTPGLEVAGTAPPGREVLGAATPDIEVPGRAMHGRAMHDRGVPGRAVPSLDALRVATSARAAPGVEVPESFHGDGPAVLAASLDAGLEGIVAKRRLSTYQPGRRSPDWVKVKNVRRQSVVIGGWEPGDGRRAHRIGALLVGVAAGEAASRTAGPGGSRFAYAGQVGTGFSDTLLDRLASLLAPLRRNTPPFPDVPPDYARKAVWVAPELIADVEFSSWTPAGRMRHPSFKGLRDDIDPSETIREP